MTVIENLSIDAVIDKALVYCESLPGLPEYLHLTRNIKDLRERLAGGRLHIAVLGQFNRGKSSFVNALLGTNVLPISVLPITSVPTVISYGEKNHCTISFSDGKDDKSVEGDTGSINAFLETFATEKNNPKNRLCVSDIIVTCKSTLLQHGTVIIDTPGFGSTYTHNTRTTLDFLSTCDAALFLLSADLPITQVEVDFLESVMKTVPRIFFIYNKIDLLSKDELAASEMFIKDTLTKTFNFPVGVNLFPVTAKNMGACKNNNEVFIKSGFARIEKEIIEFLYREKYFALSEALTGKFRDALKGILSGLETKKEELLNPIRDIKESVDQINELLTMIQDESNQNHTRLHNDEIEIINYSQKILRDKKDDLCSLFNSHLQKLLLSTGKGKPELLISAALSRLFEETFKVTYLSLLVDINKPIRKVTYFHRSELNKAVTKMYDLIDQEGEMNAHLSEISPEPREITIGFIWQSKKSYDILPPKSSIIGRFASPNKRHQNLNEYYSTVITNKVDTCLEELFEYVNTSISSLFSDFTGKIREGYTTVSQAVEEVYVSKTALLQESEEKIKPDLSKLDYLINGFNEVNEALV